MDHQKRALYAMRKARGICTRCDAKGGAVSGPRTLCAWCEQPLTATQIARGRTYGSRSCAKEAYHAAHPDAARRFGLKAWDQTNRQTFLERQREAFARELAAAGVPVTERTLRLAHWLYERGVQAGKARDQVATRRATAVRLWSDVYGGKAPA